jgi:hypothetical protein
MFARGGSHSTVPARTVAMMKADGSLIDGGLGAPEQHYQAPRRRWLGYPAGTLVFASFIVGAICAGLSVMIVAVAVRVLLGEHSGTAGSVLVTVGAVAGACVGGWRAQPMLARLLGPTRHGTSGSGRDPS